MGAVLGGERGGVPGVGGWHHPLRRLRRLAAKLPRRQRRRPLVGAQRLHRRLCRAPHPRRRTGRSIRPQTCLPRRGGPVPGRVIRLRPGERCQPPGGGAGPAGRRRCHAHAGFAGTGARRIPGFQTRHRRQCVGSRRRIGRRRRSRHRLDAGRPSRLAVGVLSQPAARSDLALVRPPDPGRVQARHDRALAGFRRVCTPHHRRGGRGAGDRPVRVAELVEIGDRAGGRDGRWCAAGLRSLGRHRETSAG